MDLRDLFVASVAGTIGIMMIYASLLNEGWCFQMKVTRAIEESMGRQRARTFIGTVGASLTFIGLYLLLAPWVATQWFQSSDQNTDFRSSQPVIANAD